jgi:hypothetical protein
MLRLVWDEERKKLKRLKGRREKLNEGKEKKVEREKKTH